VRCLIRASAASGCLTALPTLAVNTTVRNGSLAPLNDCFRETVP
jgi:hypothetical protein